MFSSPGSQEEYAAALNAFGFYDPDHELQHDFELWPDNAEAVELFQVLRNQWLMDLKGQRLGLRYEAIPATMEMMGIKRKRRPELFAELRLMEETALEYMQNDE